MGGDGDDCIKQNPTISIPGHNPSIVDFFRAKQDGIDSNYNASVVVKVNMMSIMKIIMLKLIMLYYQTLERPLVGHKSGSTSWSGIIMVIRALHCHPKQKKDDVMKI